MSKTSQDTVPLAFGCLTLALFLFAFGCSEGKGTGEDGTRPPVQTRTSERALKVFVSSPDNPNERQLVLVPPVDSERWTPGVPTALEDLGVPSSESDDSS